MEKGARIILVCVALSWMMMASSSWAFITNIDSATEDFKGKAESWTDWAKDKFSDVFNQDSVNHAAHSVKDGAGKVADKTKDMTSDVSSSKTYNDAKQNIGETYEGAKESATESYINSKSKASQMADDFGSPGSKKPN